MSPVGELSKHIPITQSLHTLGWLSVPSKLMLPVRRKPIRGRQVLQTFQSHKTEWFYPSTFCPEMMHTPELGL